MTDHLSRSGHTGQILPPGVIFFASHFPIEHDATPFPFTRKTLSALCVSLCPETFLSFAALSFSLLEASVAQISVRFCRRSYGVCVSRRSSFTVRASTSFVSVLFISAWLTLR